MREKASCLNSSSSGERWECMKTWLDNDLWHVLVFSLFSGTKRKAEERRGVGGKAGAGSIIMGGPVSFMLQ